MPAKTMLANKFVRLAFGASALVLGGCAHNEVGLENSQTVSREEMIASENAIPAQRQDNRAVFATTPSRAGFLETGQCMNPVPMFVRYFNNLTGGNYEEPIRNPDGSQRYQLTPGQCPESRTLLTQPVPKKVSFCRTITATASRNFPTTRQGYLLQRPVTGTISYPRPCPGEYTNFTYTY